MINFILWIIIGGLLGWIVGKIMRTEAHRGTWINIVVGGTGAFLAGWAVTPLFDMTTINPNNFNSQALVVALLGALMANRVQATVYALRARLSPINHGPRGS